MNQGRAWEYPVVRDWTMWNELLNASVMHGVITAWAATDSASVATNQLHQDKMPEAMSNW